MQAVRPNKLKATSPARAIESHRLRMASHDTGCLIKNNVVRLWLERAQRASIRGFDWRTSAAQNGPVIHICSQCGALILEDVERCSFCDNPLVAKDDPAHGVPIGVRPQAHGPGADAINSDLEGLLTASLQSRRRVPLRAQAQAQTQSETNEPEWRREVSRRLEEYRARRRRYHPDESQTGLPFGYQAELEECDPEPEVRERPRFRAAARTRTQERVEICIQPEFDFSSAADDRARPETGLVPVADLVERRRAGVIDALFLGLACAGFLGIFLPFGGHLIFAKLDAVVYLAVFFLFYAQYFLLFTTFAGATPGMQFRGLTIVHLDGSLPDTRQLLWRSFGYVLSGATLMLGFVWALWDEDHFTWQDRISQTYITSAVPLADGDAIEMRAQQRFAHK
jgi:uncharacterized RDD family membrane protein YckC